MTAIPTTVGHSTVLLQATVGWVPPRTPVERIAEDVSGVVLRLGFGPSPTTYHLLGLDPEQTKRVATLLNQLPTTSLEPYDECPEVTYGLAIVDLPGAEYRVQLGGCHGVTVTIGGASQPVLLGNDGLDLELTRIMGTTPDGG